MSFGLTPDGFKAKRLADIKEEVEADLKESLGESINLLPSSVLGQIVGIQSEQLEEVWELAEGVYNSRYPYTAEGKYLDNVVSITGITRQPGVKSKVDLTFLGTVGTIIPAGSVFSVEGKPTDRFVLGSDVTIADGQNEVQTIDFDAVPDAGEFKLKYNLEETIAIAFGATSQGIEDALNGLSSLSSVVVAGDFSSGFVISFEGADGLKDHATLEIIDNTLEASSVAVVGTITVTQEGFPNRVIATIESEVIGEISAPANSLTVIENPISGLDSVNNALDAILGSEIESDAELKARREESLQRAGAGTLGAIVSIIADLETVIAVVGFENITMIPTSEGMPAKSFEIIVEGGDEDVIGKNIWDNKPAGIETYGNESVQITDSQGFLKDVNFSRPTEILIYVDVKLTKDITYPVNGDDQVKEALLAYGNELGIGDDVIVYPKLMGALNDIQGITDVALAVGVAPGPTQDNNIIVAADEISRWDSSRITIGDL